jgi:hypothetical protein
VVDVSQRLLLTVSVRLLLRQVRSSNSQMLRLTRIQQTLTRIMARTALLGFFALADFALWYVHHCRRLGIVCSDIAWVAWCRSLPHGPSNPHGERNETSVRRNEGAQARTRRLKTQLTSLVRLALVLYRFQTHQYWFDSTSSHTTIFWDFYVVKIHSA